MYAPCMSRATLQSNISKKKIKIVVTCVIYMLIIICRFYYASFIKRKCTIGFLTIGPQFSVDFAFEFKPQTETLPLGLRGAQSQ